MPIGVYERPRMDPYTYFFDRISICVTGCWNWTGIANRYGIMGIRSHHNMLAHRFAFDTFVGELQPEDAIHHKCRNKLCVNPKHLMRVKFTAHGHLHNVPTTHCKRGHERTEKDTYWHYSETCGWTRHCRPCRADRYQRSKWQQKLEEAQNGTER